MYDYDGDMEYFQGQLSEKGISKEMLNLDDYAGLTARELQQIVDHPQCFMTKGTNNGD